MDFEKMYRVMVKYEGSFQGTGQTEDGEVTVEGNVINQLFYTHDKALKLKGILEDDGFEVILRRGGK